MTKDEAVLAMEQGQKVTHRTFSDKEWMTISGVYIVFEDGNKCIWEEFWKWRCAQTWEDGYRLYKEPDL